MATATGSYVLDNSTLAHFQNWVAPIWNAFTGFGWAQTADTGQSANPPTAVPSSAYVNQIFKATDTAAGTTPIYVKVECGFSSTLARIQITMGSGSDGAGNITGSIIGPINITAAATYANQGATTFACYFSGDAGTFRMMMWQGSTTFNTILVIERSRDTSGNATTDYATFLSCNADGTGGWNQQSMYPGSPNVTQAGQPNTAVPASTGFYSVTGKVAANPVIPLVGFPGNQMLGIVSAAAADVAESNGTVVTVNLYGANHSYLFSQKSTLVNFGKLTAAGVNGSPGMLYE